MHVTSSRLVGTFLLHLLRPLLLLYHVLYIWYFQLMLTFLRRIRKSLIDSNATKKYLLYAIGEIALVVIGILLALQINTWNTNRIDRKQEQAYLQKIKSEIEKDVEDFERREADFLERQTAAEYILNFWISDRPFPENPDEFIDNFFGANGPAPWYSEPVTWTLLIQSGELDKIKDENLVDLLFDYYADLRKTANNWDDYPTQVINEIRSVLAASFSDDDYLWAVERKEGHKPKRTTIQKIVDSEAELKDKFARCAVIYRIHKTQMRMHKRRGDEVLEYLDSIKLAG